MGNVKLIKPSEVAVKTGGLPDGVIEVFNELISTNWNGCEATIKQKEAIKAICAKMNCDSKKVIAEHWLDVEDVYSNSGWVVEYEKPDYNADSSFEPYFVFKKKATRRGR